MKNIVTTILGIFVLVIGFTSVIAQEVTPQSTPEGAKIDKPVRPKLLEELGLTKDQMQQLRRINKQQQPLLKEAQKNLAIAQKTLDEAVYADILDENDIRNKLKEVQKAQSEVLKNRLFIEFYIRKILNAEQLVKFRELRQKMKDNEVIKKEILNNRKFPNRNQLNRPNQ
jgi:Spy/CpxP family protein refolding chaperone